MGLFKEYNPDQILLMSPELRQWLPGDHLAYFVSDLIDQLDLKGIYAKYSQGHCCPVKVERNALNFSAIGF